MTEVKYSAQGYNFFAPLGKGLGIMALKIDTVASGYTITTPFARCVPIVTPSVGTPDISCVVTEDAGQVTITAGAGITSTSYNVIIMGAMY